MRATSLSSLSRKPRQSKYDSSNRDERAHRQPVESRFESPPSSLARAASAGSTRPSPSVEDPSWVKDASRLASAIVRSERASNRSKQLDAPRSLSRRALAENAAPMSTRPLGFAGFGGSGRSGPSDRGARRRLDFSDASDSSATDTFFPTLHRSGPSRLNALNEKSILRERLDDNISNFDAYGGTSGGGSGSRRAREAAAAEDASQRSSVHGRRTRGSGRSRSGDEDEEQESVDDDEAMERGRLEMVENEARMQQSTPPPQTWPRSQGFMGGMWHALGIQPRHALFALLLVGAVYMLWKYSSTSEPKVKLAGGAASASAEPSSELASAEPGARASPKSKRVSRAVVHAAPAAECARSQEWDVPRGEANARERADSFVQARGAPSRLPPKVAQDLEPPRRLDALGGLSGGSDATSTMRNASLQPHLMRQHRPQTPPVVLTHASANRGATVSAPSLVGPTSVAWMAPTTYGERSSPWTRPGALPSTYFASATTKNPAGAQRGTASGSGQNTPAPESPGLAHPPDPRKYSLGAQRAQASSSSSSSSYRLDRTSAHFAPVPSVATSTDAVRSERTVFAGSSDRNARRASSLAAPGVARDRHVRFSTAPQTSAQMSLPSADTAVPRAPVALKDAGGIEAGSCEDAGMSVGAEGIATSPVSTVCPASDPAIGGDKAAERTKEAGAEEEEKSVADESDEEASSCHGGAPTAAEIAQRVAKEERAAAKQQYDKARAEAQAAIRVSALRGFFNFGA